MPEETPAAGSRPGSGERRLEVTRSSDGRLVLASLGGALPVGIRMTDAEALAVTEALLSLLRAETAQAEAAGKKE